MVFKEDVLQWFKEMESYERIELMHELLHMCLPFEVRFLGGCVEEVGKHSFQELRGPSIIANDIDKLSKDATQLSSGVLDRKCRHRMCVYLSLLENRNCQCAHWYFKQVFRTERFDEFAMRRKCLDDSVVLNELLMVFTLGRLHPAFNYHQKDFFSDMLHKLYRIRADKSNVVKNAVGVPNYPPGFGYPNQIVPYDRYVILCDQSSTIHQQPPQLQQQQPLDTVCILKTSSTVPSSSSTQGVASACAGGDLVAVAAPAPPGLLPAQPQHQYQHHPLQYEHFHTTYWRQQPMYTLSDAHMMAPPPQPVSPLVSQCASPPHSRPASPSPSNHSTQSTSSTTQQQQQQQQHLRSSSSSLRASKTSSLDSHNSPQSSPMQQLQQVPVRMPSTTVFLAPGSIQQIHSQNEVFKMAENESNHVLSDDVKSSNSLLHQDWTNPALTSHLHNFNTAQPPLFTFAPHHPQQLGPHNAHAPNGLRQCFATNFQQHHAVIAVDQHQAMFGYDLDYQQQQQQLNDTQLDNTLHRSGSSSNNSSNASSLNQSPPDTPASTPTPAHHGPGRGSSRDGIGGITEKLRVLNNVNNVSFMTPPPPPISDGNVPPQQQQQPFAANVSYTGFGAGRPIYGRIPSFGHSFSAPPPALTPAQQVHAAQAHVQPQATAYIMGTAFIVPTILSTNGNNSAVPPHTNSNTITGSLRSHQHSHQHPSSTNTNKVCAGTNASTSLASAMLTSPSSGMCCTFCCNCGSADHRDEDCTVPHIDDIVTQVGYALDYHDSSGGGSVVGHGQGAGGPSIVAIDHVRPDI